MDSDRCNVSGVVKAQLDEIAIALEARLDADVLSYCGPILFGFDHQFRLAIESFGDQRRPKMAIVLDTPGGVVEVVERMVEFVRHHYDDVAFIIPDRAMSAGTVLAMSGNTILMDHFSRLGPIDPQIEKDGKLVPALSYLVQYRRLLKRAHEGLLSNAEFALLAKFDLAEIHQYEQARNLTTSLLEKWLATYKFKDWHVTETHKIPVDDAMRRQRAHQIARDLSNNMRWHSHGRGISIDTLRSELNLKIDDFGENRDVCRLIRRYHHLLSDYLFLHRDRLVTFLHTREFF